jgi:hypothetical protein
MALIKETPMSISVWHQLPFVRELLWSICEHIDPRSPGSAAALSKRRYQRANVRKIAICLDGASQFAAYAKDISRTGVGFFCTSGHSLQQAVDLWLPHGETIALCVVRCRQLADHCFEVGTVFRTDTASV